MKATIDEIMDLREEYYSMEDVIDHSILEAKDETQEVDHSSIEFNPMLYPELLRIRKDMSCLSLTLARKVGSYIIDYEKSEGQRKIEYFKKKNEMIAPPNRNKIGEAESLAEEYTQAQRLETSISKGLYSAGKLVLSQVNEVLKSLNQDIAIIRKEYESIAG